MSRATRAAALSKRTDELLALINVHHDLENGPRVYVTDFEQAPTLGPYVFEVWFFAEYSDGLATADMPEVDMTGARRGYTVTMPYNVLGSKDTFYLPVLRLSAENDRTTDMGSHQ